MNHFEIKIILKDGSSIKTYCRPTAKETFLNKILTNGCNAHINEVETWFPAHAIEKIEVR